MISDARDDLLLMVARLLLAYGREIPPEARLRLVESMEFVERAQSILRNGREAAAAMDRREQL